MEEGHGEAPSDSHSMTGIPGLGEGNLRCTIEASGLSREEKQERGRSVEQAETGSGSGSSVGSCPPRTFFLQMTNGA